MAERPAGQLDPWVGDRDDPVAIADFEGETEFMQQEDEERRQNGPHEPSSKWPPLPAPVDPSSV